MSKKSVVKLTLTRELDNGGTEAEQIVIRKLRFRQFNRTLAIVSQILEKVEEKPELKNMFMEMFFGSTFDETAVADLPLEQVAALRESWAKDRDNRFLWGIISSFKIILSELPDLAIELLAVMGKIDFELMYDQEVEVGFDVLDAILEVNDIEELVVRGKQSLGLARTAFEFMNPKNKVEPGANVLANAPRP